MPLASKEPVQIEKLLCNSSSTHELVVWIGMTLKQNYCFVHRRLKKKITSSDHELTTDSQYLSFLMLPQRETKCSHVWPNNTTHIQYCIVNLISMQTSFLHRFWDHDITKHIILLDHGLSLSSYTTYGCTSHIRLLGEWSELIHKALTKIILILSLFYYSSLLLRPAPTLTKHPSTNCLVYKGNRSYS